MALAFMVCVALLCGTGLAAWILWLQKQPTCTPAEFQKVVAQVNRLTESMATVQATADSMRAAVGMTRITGSGR